jgi:hypothetical protein
MRQDWEREVVTPLVVVVSQVEATQPAALAPRRYP